ncbi:ERAD-associated E3 ubiquitin-protein ligase DOA10 [Diplonema papillatum]|nr:ERAD-associated E3 ubiquitin-protein ligase DOA10 [Diplonema papillatum]
MNLADDEQDDEEEPEENECRICKDIAEPLVKPCACKGSIGFVHEACLAKWMKRSASGTAAIRCEVCDAPIRVHVSGFDFFSFPFTPSTHEFSDALLISVLVIALSTSTFVFFLSAISEFFDVDLWNVTIRWILTPAMMVLKMRYIYIWTTPGTTPPQVPLILMEIFRWIPSVSELLYISFLTTTRIMCTAVFEKDTHPLSFRVLIFTSALTNYIAMLCLMKRAFSPQLKSFGIEKNSPSARLCSQHDLAMIDKALPGVGPVT